MTQAMSFHRLEEETRERNEMKREAVKGRKESKK